MDKAEMLTQIVKMLDSVTLMISVLAIGQRLTEASSESERVNLTIALASILKKEHVNVGTILNDNYGQNGFM